MSTCHVLSLDIDFFVEPTATDIEEASERLPADEYAVESESAVDEFLELRCQMGRNTNHRGIHVRDHDSAYHVIEYLVHNEAASVVLHHIDAHADLGMGDAGWSYLLNEWLWLTTPRSVPQEPTLGNWLAFVAANQWLEEVEFVPKELTILETVS